MTSWAGLSKLIVAHPPVQSPSVSSDCFIVLITLTIIWNNLVQYLFYWLIISLSVLNQKLLGSKGFPSLVHNYSLGPGPLQHSRHLSMFVAWITFRLTVLEIQGHQACALAFIAGNVRGHLVTVSSSTFHLNPWSLRFISEFNQM